MSAPANGGQLLRYLLTRPIHGFQVGDRFLVDTVDGSVTMVRQQAWNAEALCLAELNDFAVELLPDTPENRRSGGRLA